jgi:hypothetical protein
MYGSPHYERSNIVAGYTADRVTDAYSAHVRFVTLPYYTTFETKGLRLCVGPFQHTRMAAFVLFPFSL